MIAQSANWLSPALNILNRSHDIRKYTVVTCIYAMKRAKLLIFWLSLFLSNTVFALRCGNSLVDIGDYKYDVYEKCGAPESIGKSTKIIGNTFHFPHRTIDIEEYEEVKVETWIYNFGSLRFKQYLRFENDVLVEIKTLGRGDH
jgi:hypothetical protein